MHKIINKLHSLLATQSRTRSCMNWTSIPAISYRRSMSAIIIMGLGITIHYIMKVFADHDAVNGLKLKRK